MKAERVILSFIAIIVGLVAAGIAFYLYQMTRSLPSQKNKPLSVSKSIVPATPTPDPNNFLTVDKPKDEEVFPNKTITVSGKTVPGATLIVSSEETDQIAKPASNGSYSLTIPIPDDTTILTVTAVLPSGDEKKVTRTVTFSTESF